jgi:hypothetical protein
MAPNTAGRHFHASAEGLFNDNYVVYAKLKSAG